MADSTNASTVADEMITIQQLLVRRKSPVKFPKPHMPGYQGHAPGGEVVGRTPAVATANMETIKNTMSTTGSLKGTLGLTVDHRPVGEQDFYSEESQLWAYDFGRRRMENTGDYRSM